MPEWPRSKTTPPYATVPLASSSPPWPYSIERTCSHETRQLVIRNLEVLERFFADHQGLFQWQPPRAGPVAFPSLRNGEHVESFCSRLLTEAGVLLLPGTVYDDAYDRHFRIGFGRKDFRSCIARVAEFLTAYHH